MIFSLKTEHVPYVVCLVYSLDGMSKCTKSNGQGAFHSKSMTELSTSPSISRGWDIARFLDVIWASEYISTSDTECITYRMALSVTDILKSASCSTPPSRTFVQLP